MKILKNNVKLFIGIFIGILFSSVSVYAAYKYLAIDVTFTPSDSNWNVTNVEEALNDLYSKKILIEEPILVGSGNIGYSSAKTSVTRIPSTLHQSTYMSLNNNEFTVKKEGYYLITFAVGSNLNSNSRGLGWNGYTYIYLNNAQKTYISQSWDMFKTSYIIEKLNADDTIYFGYRGNGGADPKRSEYRIFYIGYKD